MKKYIFNQYTNKYILDKIKQNLNIYKLKYIESNYLSMIINY